MLSSFAINILQRILRGELHPRHAPLALVTHVETVSPPLSLLSANSIVENKRNFKIIALAFAAAYLS